MLALTGCKTGKTSASGQSGKPDEVVILEKEIIEKENHSKETPGGVTPGQVAYANLDTRYAMLTGSWKAWRDVELGAKIRLLSPAKFNAAGKVYMKRGEWISVSVRMLGFEAFKSLVVKIRIGEMHASLLEGLITHGRFATTSHTYHYLRLRTIYLHECFFRSMAKGLLFACFQLILLIQENRF